MEARPRPKPPANNGGKKQRSRPLDRSNQLKEETRKMEDRLAKLRVAMGQERTKWESMPRRKDGSIWKAARTVDSNKYADHVKDKVAKRIHSRGSSRRSSESSPVPPPSDDMKKTLPIRGQPITKGPSRVSGGTSTTPGMGASAGSSASTSDGGGQAGAADDSSAGSLLHGAFDESGGHSSFAAARESFLEDQHIPYASSASASASSASAAASPAPPSGQPGSLLQGSFDESTSSGSFQEARKQWMVQTDRAPPPAPSAASAQARPATPGSLLEGTYDETENANAFAEARQSWLRAQQQQEDSHTAAQTWNVARSQTPVRRARPPSAQGSEAGRKSSCYQCYKLFYADMGSHDDKSDKDFCTPACARVYHIQNSVMCARPGCGSSLPRTQAVLKGDGMLYCAECGDDGDDDKETSSSARTEASGDGSQAPAGQAAQSARGLVPEPEVSFPDSDEEN